MKNDLLSIGGFTIHGYGLMIGIGFLAAYLFCEIIIIPWRDFEIVAEAV